MRLAYLQFKVTLAGNRRRENRRTPALARQYRDKINDKQTT